MQCSDHMVRGVRVKEQVVFTSESVLADPFDPHMKSFKISKTTGYKKRRRMKEVMLDHVSLSRSLIGRLLCLPGLLLWNAPAP